MSLPNTDFEPPGLTVARICKNCKFYTSQGSTVPEGWNGVCKLQQLVDKDAPPRPIHGTFRCDAHVFKTIGITVHRLCDKYNIKPPDQHEL